MVRYEVCAAPLHPKILILKDTFYPSDWAEVRDGRLLLLVRGGGPDGVLAEEMVPSPPLLERSKGPRRRRVSRRRPPLLDDVLGNLAHADPLAGAAGTPGTRRYEAFGTVRSETGATMNVERGFAGLVPEGDTGLLYARARHYEPETGRFLQPEPMGLFQPNLYSYASNNPVVFSDPSGLEAGRTNFFGPPDFLSFGSGDPFSGGGGSSGGSLGQTVAGVATGLLAGAGVGAGIGAAGTAAAVFCPACGAAVIGIGVGLASVKLEVDSGFAGIRGFVEAAKAVASGDATFGQAFSAGFLPGSLAGGFLGARAASSFLPAVDVGAEIQASVLGTRGGAGPVRLGQIGEELAGITGPKSQIPSATGTANFRVPDELTDTALREVKNVERLRTGGRAGNQLRDFSEFARPRGLECVLCVRQGTQISPRSQQFLDELGFVVERKLP